MRVHPGVLCVAVAAIAAASSCTSGAIVFDSGSAIVDDSDSADVNWIHTIGPGANRVLVVGVSAEDNDLNNLVVESITFNGAPMSLVAGSTAIVGKGYRTRTELYYLLESNLPPAGSYAVEVNYGGVVEPHCAGAISLANVAQMSPVAAAANAIEHTPTISTDINVPVDDAWLVDMFGCSNWGTAVTTSAGMVERWDISGQEISAASSTKHTVFAGPTTMGWQRADPGDRLTHSIAVFAPDDMLFIAGDFDLDDDVDLADALIFALQWLSAGDCSPEPDCADLDGSHDVDYFDFALMAENWGL